MIFNKYSIKSEMGFLCDGRGEFKDKYGNKRSRLIYWSDYNDAEVIRWNIIRLLSLRLSIRLFAPDIKDVRIINQRGKE